MRLGEFFDARILGAQIRFEPMNGILRSAHVALKIVRTLDAHAQLILRGNDSLRLVDAFGFKLDHAGIGALEERHLRAVVGFEFFARREALVALAGNRCKLRLEPRQPLALLGDDPFGGRAQRGGGKRRGFVLGDAQVRSSPAPPRRSRVPAPGCASAPRPDPVPVYAR